MLDSVRDARCDLRKTDNVLCTGTDASECTAAASQCCERRYIFVDICSRKRSSHLAAKPQHAAQACSHEDPAGCLRSHKCCAALERLPEAPSHRRLHVRESTVARPDRAISFAEPDRGNL